MLFNFIAFGGILFWSIVAVVALIITALIDDRKTLQATSVLFIAAAILFGVSSIPIVAYVKANPANTVYYILGYLAAAAIWATIKWRLFFLPKLFEAYDTVRKQYLADKGYTELPAGDAAKEALLKYAGQHGVYINRDRMVSQNKANIMTWIAYWPFSLLGTFIGDFLHRVVTWIYQNIAGSLQRLSDRMASRYSELS